MLRLLLNANLSPETAQFLRQYFSFDVRCLLEDSLGKIADADVADLAKQEQRIIITSDLDFGQIYHFDKSNKLGVIVLRLSNQTVENVNEKLKRFFKEYQDDSSLPTTLVVIEDKRYRFYKRGRK